MFAPIVLFTYSRVDHTRRAVESLLTNAEAKESDLFIFSDGAKDESKECAVNENRRYIHTIAGFKSVTIIEREKNYGLANSLISGITEVIDKYEKVIVVEDDLIVSPYFLKFMNDGLEKYKDDDKVGAISAYVYPVKEVLPNTFFLKYFNCWGWGIWKRSWSLLNTDVKHLLRQLRFKKNAFEYGGNGAYGNLYCTKIGLVDSWWVRLYASLFLNDKLTLYPCSSLVINDGFDGSGVHCGSDESSLNSTFLYEKPVDVTKIKAEENEDAKKAYISFWSERNNQGCFDRIKSFIRRMFFIDSL